MCQMSWVFPVRNICITGIMVVFFLYKMLATSHLANEHYAFYKFSVNLCKFLSIAANFGALRYLPVYHFDTPRSSLAPDPDHVTENLRGQKSCNITLQGKGANVHGEGS